MGSLPSEDGMNKRKKWLREGCGSTFERMAGLILPTIVFFFLLFLKIPSVFAQAEMMPWGNLDGIRISGQLMDFQTRLDLPGLKGDTMQYTGKELQNPVYSHNGETQDIQTRLGDFHIEETVTELGKGTASLIVRSTALNDEAAGDGIFLEVDLSTDSYSMHEARWSLTGGSVTPGLFKDSSWTQVMADGVAFPSGNHFFSVHSEAPSTVYWKMDRSSSRIRLLFPMGDKLPAKGASLTGTFKFHVSGKIDHSLATLQINPAVQGRPFEGIGCKIPG